MPRMKTIAVGDSFEDSIHRHVVNHWKKSQEDYNQGAVIDFNGFSHHMKFLAFESQRPNTVKFAVGKKEEDQRVIIEKMDNPGQTIKRQGWARHMEFWAFDKAMPGTIRIVVGFAFHPHRICFNHGYED